MKKLFLACGIALSAVALATATEKKETNSLNDNVSTYQDTVPKKDTTKKPIPDSLSVHLSAVN